MYWYFSGFARVNPVLLYLVFGLMGGCNSGQINTIDTRDIPEKSGKIFQVVTPAAEEIYILNEPIDFEIKANQQVDIDSTILFFEGNKIHSESDDPLKFSFSGMLSKVGRQSIRIKVHYNDSLSQNLSLRLILFARDKPVDLRYEVLKTIPHNRQDFTQGLFYYNGFLYEGTGRRNHSRIIKTNPDNGSVLMEHRLADELFGEGITRVGDKLYQLTYQRKVGFIYALENFEKIREFDLQTMEGWGLTYDGKNLIMSDGTSVLYFYHPEYLTLSYQLDVANNRSLVNNLNELEYARGAIWANVYGKNHIVKIDPGSGAVVAVLDLEDLFPEDIPRDYDHVLNGIAYNPDSKTYYVTGKYWPVMYEIKILE